MFQGIRGRSNFAKVGTEYADGQLCIYTQGNQIEIQNQTHWTLNGSSTPVSSPSSILPPPSSHCLINTSTGDLFHGTENWTIKKRFPEKNERGTNEIFKNGLRFNNTGKPNGHSKTD